MSYINGNRDKKVEYLSVGVHRLASGDHFMFLYYNNDYEDEGTESLVTNIFQSIAQEYKRDQLKAQSLIYYRKCDDQKNKNCF